VKYRVIVRPEAENDIEGAFTWYEDKRQGLGYDFLLQLDAGLRIIEIDPEIFPPGYKATRKHAIRRFPYKIIYLVEKERIIVLAVVHGKRDPELIRERIDGI